MCIGKYLIRICDVDAWRSELTPRQVGALVPLRSGGLRSTAIFDIPLRGLYARFRNPVFKLGRAGPTDTRKTDILLDCGIFEVLEFYFFNQLIVDNI